MRGGEREKVDKWARGRCVVVSGGGGDLRLRRPVTPVTSPPPPLHFTAQVLLENCSYESDYLADLPLWLMGNDSLGHPGCLVAVDIHRTRLTSTNEQTNVPISPSNGSRIQSQQSNHPNDVRLFSLNPSFQCLPPASYSLYLALTSTLHLQE